MTGEKRIDIAVEEFVRRLLAEVLGIEVEDVDRDASITSTAGWDSFAHAELCERVSQILNQDLSDGLVEACSTAHGLVAIFEEKPDLNLLNWTSAD